ncbi:MAG: NUDIX domain-containing protein [Rhodococcus sp.]|nr:NUDIX domain-containing protein [Rhodococcus sp. (in: high G+C Gram-positive bacteria)]
MAPDDSQHSQRDTPIRDASTVVLLRDGHAGIEVFLQRRVKGMAFAGGMTVFPGGGVDASDVEAEIAWAGPGVEWWAERFATDEARARALVCAAARETFEECGVLLAGPSIDTVVDDSTRYTQARGLLERRELSFSEFLRREDLVLRSDLLRPWANWITPVGEGRRYDTRFFVAAAPDGQKADGATSEAEQVGWWTPAQALDDWRAQGSVLLPPTWSQLTALAEFGSVADVLAYSPRIEAILPTLTNEDGRVHVEFPGQDGYYGAGPHPWASQSAE